MDIERERRIKALVKSTVAMVILARLVGTTLINLLRQVLALVAAA